MYLRWIKEMESRRLADLDDERDILGEEQHQTMASSPDSAHHNIEVLEPAVPTDVSHDRRRSVAADRAVARSFIVRDCRRYSLVNRRGTVSNFISFINGLPSGGRLCVPTSICSSVCLSVCPVPVPISGCADTSSCRWAVYLPAVWRCNGRLAATLLLC